MLAISMLIMSIIQIDHFVITLEKAGTLGFYRKLGFNILQFNQNRYAIALGQQKINIHFTNQTILPRAKHPSPPGSADLCVEVDNLVAMQQHLEKHNIAIELGPIDRTGARGPMRSIYIRDPEGNLIELCSYN